MRGRRVDGDTRRDRRRRRVSPPRPRSPCPGSRSVAPASRSLPAVRTEPPRSTGTWARIATGTGPVASRPRGPARPVGVEWRRVLDRDDRVCPVRDAAPVAIRAAVPGWTATSGATPAADVADDGEPDGVVLGGAGRVRRDDRVAVHRRVVPGRQRDSRDRGLGEHPAERVGDTDPDRRARFARREGRVASLLDAAQAPGPRLFRGRHAALNPAWPAR